MRCVGLLFLLLAASEAGAASIQEDFSVNPAVHGWQTFGNSSLFHWNVTNLNLEVTWDSLQPNSYFWRPLGTVLAKEDAFSVEFDLTMIDANATGFFQLAIGLFNHVDATGPGFSRATGNARNLFEFDYFPDGGFGPSVDATMSDRTVSSTDVSHFYFAYDNVPLDPGTTYHVLLSHGAGDSVITGLVNVQGQSYTSLPYVYPGPIEDFRLDALSISSYTTQDDPYGDLLLAHGVIDNINVLLPPLPVDFCVGGFTNGIWQVQFTSRTNWSYDLQRTTDFRSWTNVANSAGM